MLYLLHPISALRSHLNKLRVQKKFGRGNKKILAEVSWAWAKLNSSWGKAAKIGRQMLN